MAGSAGGGVIGGGGVGDWFVADLDARKKDPWGIVAGLSCQRGDFHDAAAGQRPTDMARGGYNLIDRIIPVPGEGDIIDDDPAIPKTDPVETGAGTGPHVPIGVAMEEIDEVLRKPFGHC